MPITLTEQRRPLIVVALLASLLLHALAVALAPKTQSVVKAVAAPLELMVVQTMKPVPAPVPPPPAPAPAVKRRAPTAAKQPVAPPENVVRDLDGEVEAPAVPEPPTPPIFHLPLAPKVEGTKPAAEAAGPVVVATTDASLEREVVAPYPEAAQREGIEGVVVLRVTVAEDGRVLEVVVLEEPGYGLGDAARAAVLKSTFKPATRGGVAVRSTLTWRYRFELR
ncbi:MAG: TonB family protein [Myxococcaceae bacterium]|nr:TonB family protein [Myxococcaceae bacterium]